MINVQQRPLPYMHHFLPEVLI